MLTASRCSKGAASTFGKVAGWPLTFWRALWKWVRSSFPGPAGHPPLHGRAPGERGADQGAGEGPETSQPDQLYPTQRTETGAGYGVCQQEAVVQPEHMADLVVQAGFEVAGVYGSFALEPYAGGETCLMVACKRRG